MATSTKIKDASVINVTNGLKLAVGNTSDDTTASAITVSGLKTFIDSDKSTVATTGSYNDLTNKPNLNEYALLTTLNSNFYNKREIDNLLSNINGAEFKIVDSLPSVGESNIIYLLLNEQNVYDEYVWLPESESYQNIGTTQVSMSNYYTKSETDSRIPSVGNGTITINQDGVEKGHFTLNQSNNATIEIESSSFIQEQSDWTEQDPESPKYIQNKPQINNVGDGTITFKMGETVLGGFSTNQTLSDTITIPETSQVQVDWNVSDNTSPRYIINKPTIPTVNNPTIYFSQGGVIKGSITLNQSSSATIALDGGGSGGSVQSNWNETDSTSMAFIQNKPTLATVATSGNYNDLNGKPSLSTVATSGNYNDLNGKPSLSTVATSGNYNDLNGKPSLSTVATSGSYTDLTNRPTIPTNTRSLLITYEDESTETIVVYTT